MSCDHQENASRACVRPSKVPQGSDMYVGSEGAFPKVASDSSAGSRAKDHFRVIMQYTYRRDGEELTILRFPAIVSLYIRIHQHGKLNIDDLQHKAKIRICTNGKNTV